MLKRPCLERQAEQFILYCAPCWDRTNDLFDVNEALYH